MERFGFGRGVRVSDGGATDRDNGAALAGIGGRASPAHGRLAAPVSRQAAFSLLSTSVLFRKSRRLREELQRERLSKLLSCLYHLCTLDAAAIGHVHQRAQSKRTGTDRYGSIGAHPPAYFKVSSRCRLRLTCGPPIA